MERWWCCCWCGNQDQVVEVLIEVVAAARVALLDILRSNNRDDLDDYVGWQYPIGGVW